MYHFYKCCGLFFNAQFKWINRDWGDAGTAITICHLCINQTMELLLPHALLQTNTISIHICTMYIYMSYIQCAHTHVFTNLHFIDKYALYYSANLKGKCKTWTKQNSNYGSTAGRTTTCNKVALLPYITRTWINIFNLFAYRLTPKKKEKPETKLTQYRISKRLRLGIWILWCGWKYITRTSCVRAFSDGGNW